MQKKSIYCSFFVKKGMIVKMKDTTLTFLGKDSGFKKNNNSAYIEKNNDLILIDCGFAIFEKAKEKFNFSKYDNIKIIITHLHNDHAGSLSQLIMYLWFVLNKKVTVISNCKDISTYLKITGTPEESYSLSSKEENIKFIKTEHVKEIDSYGFEMIIDNKKIVYTGDTKTIEPFENFVEDADEFYVDVSKFGGVHLKIDDILEKLQKIQQKGTKIILMHMDDEQYIIDKFTNN